MHLHFFSYQVKKNREETLSWHRVTSFRKHKWFFCQKLVLFELGSFDKEESQKEPFSFLVTILVCVLLQNYFLSNLAHTIFMKLDGAVHWFFNTDNVCYNSLFMQRLKVGFQTSGNVICLYQEIYKIQIY